MHSLAQEFCEPSRCGSEVPTGATTRVPTGLRMEHQSATVKIVAAKAIQKAEWATDMGEELKG